MLGGTFGEPPKSRGGRYELDLARPYDRSLLRMLYKKCDTLGSDTRTTISWIDENRSVIQRCLSRSLLQGPLPSREERWQISGNSLLRFVSQSKLCAIQPAIFIYVHFISTCLIILLASTCFEVLCKVPESGRLSFTFSADWRFSEEHCWDYRRAIHLNWTANRFYPSIHKTAQLLHQWNLASADPETQTTILEAAFCLVSFPLCRCLGKTLSSPPRSCKKCATVNQNSSTMCCHLVLKPQRFTGTWTCTRFFVYILPVFG